MGERLRYNLAPPGSVKRRKSFFRRIADSISSFVPSNFFSGGNTTVCDNNEINGSPLQCNEIYSQSARNFDGSRTPVVRDTDTQTMTVVDNHGTINVDLDAADFSEGEMSAHSSTSGVSSLIPRNFATKPFGIKTKAYSVPVSDTPDGYMFHSRSATCSDGMDSIASTSTFRPPSVTPWILSHGLESPTTIRPTKRQKISDQSINSSYESDRMSLFYQAKTTYGGAASCRNQMRRNGILEPTTPLRFELEGSSRGSMSGSEPVTATNLSSTARRILESLERFTTPLATADRVPLPLGTPGDVRSTPFPLKKTFRSHRFPPYMQAYKRLKTLQHEKRELSSYSQATPSESHPSSTASSTSDPLPSSVPYAISATSSVPATTTWSSTLSSSSVSGFGFQNLPLLKKTDTKVSTSQLEVTPKCTDVPPSSISLPNTSATYTFASPIRLPPSIATQPVKLSIDLTPKFSFSSPIRSCRSSIALFRPTSSSTTTSYAPVTSTAASVVTTSSITTGSPIFNLITKPTIDQRSEIPSAARDPKVVLPNFNPSKSWRCETCLLENPETKQLCSACSMPRIKQTATPVSCVTSSTTQVTTNLPLVAKHPTVSTDRWECPVCMIFNEIDARKCIACGASPSSGGSKSPMTVEKEPTPKQLPAPPDTTKKWECPTCMVFNDCDQTQCACCATSKPNAKSEAVAAQWECPTCMVSNAGDKATCPCCSTPKPGVSDTASVTTIKTKFTMPAVSTSLFSFGSSVPSMKFGLQPPGLSSAVTATTNSTSNSSSLPLDTKASLPAIGGPIFGQQVPTTVFDIPKTSVPSLPPVFKFGSSTSTMAASTATSNNTTTTTTSDLTKLTVTSSNTTILPFSFTQPAVSVSSGEVLPAVSAPLFNFDTKQPAVSKSNPEQQQPSSTPAPLFRFGFGSDSKSSLVNGLVNGGSNVNLFTPSVENNEQPRVSSAQPSCGLNFSSTTTPMPKFEFGALKPPSTVGSSVSQPVFVFGAPFRPASSTVATTNSSFAPGTTTSAPSSLTLGSSQSAPFLFGPAQTSFTTAPVTSGVFCFGANTQPMINSEAKPAMGFDTPVQPTLFGQNIPTSNVFSANSTSISARKKVHATRRLHR